MFMNIYTHVHTYVNVYNRECWWAEEVWPKDKAGARPALSKQIGRKSWNSRCSHSSDDGGSPSGNALQQSPHTPP